MKKFLLIAVVASIGVGCASYVETVRIDPEKWQTKGSSVRGVVYYEPQLVKLKYEFTQRSGVAECKRVIQKEEIVTLPDFKNPVALIHKPSWFSSSEFSVNLDKGMLVSVNSTSTPQTPEILQQIIPTVGPSGMQDSLTCDSEPVITAVKPIAFYEN